jgi:hypothetical protein
MLIQTSNAIDEPINTRHINGRKTYMIVIFDAASKCIGELNNMA